MKRTVGLLSVLSFVIVCTINFEIRTAQTQSPVAIGRFLSPNRSQVHQAAVPFTIQWQLDNEEEVKSQDLIIETDLGAAKIAAYLRPQQDRLLWSAAPAHVTQRARLKILLRLKIGGETTIDSDEFSILPAPPNPPPANLGVSSAGGVAPAFAGTGSCVTGTLPTLNYNLSHTLPCPADFGGEPALAQDPNNPTRFQTVTGFTTHLRGRNVNWGFSGSSTVRFLNFAGNIARQDLSMEVGIDGKSYATALAESTLGAFDKLMIFRSTDGGSSFSIGVEIPRPPQILAVDKPVITVHPTNAQILAVTFQQVSGGGLVATWVGICKQAATGNLASASNWVFFQPKDGGGTPLKGWFTTHPLIDPVSTTSPFYWLFVVFTNNDFSGGCCQGPAGITVFKYEVDNVTQALANNGNPVQTLNQALGYPLWTNNPSCTKIEQQLRVQIGCSPTNKNATKAAIDYCDPNAHRMYIPTLANTTGYFGDGLTSDLFMTVWTYTGGSQGTVTKRILPAEKEKYVACAMTDGHGRVWVSAFAVTSLVQANPHRAQLGAIAIDRITGDPGSVAYMSVGLPVSLSYTDFSQYFMGDYVYTQGTWYSDPNDPGNVNGQGSRTAMPTYVDLPSCGAERDFWIGLGGWN